MDMSPDSPIALTRQVNDLARLDNRQSNVTNTFRLPKTANNIRNLGKVTLVGNQSNLPYEKLTADLFDSDSGACLIYQGWATLKEGSDDYFSLYVYDGVIDFYRTIENLNLTQVGISELNHVKNLANVVASFSDNLNYKYIIADYNGKNYYDSASINIDYQIPSAKVSFFWSRIFDFAGFTFSGSIFNDPKFVNLWMTFPKPVPTSDPIVTEITDQISGVSTRYDQFFENTVYTPILCPIPFTTPEITNSTIVNITGSYRLVCDGVLTVAGVEYSAIHWRVTNGSGTIIKSKGEIDAKIHESVIMSAEATDRIVFYVVSPDSEFPYFSVGNNIGGSIHTTLDLVIGYDANFEDALIDFSAKEFVNEIVQRFALTMFKDKYSNNVEFRTMEEILQDENIIDWSEKFVKRGPEKYILGQYAKRNLLKYKYNDENDNRNDGYITVNNANLSDETTIISSKIYSPEKSLPFLGADRNVYKFWNKEIGDDNLVKYKELSGRFYFLRSEELQVGSISIGSEALNTVQNISSLPVSNFSRLSFKEIVLDNYSSIESILDKSKMSDNALFFLKPRDIESFTFKNLIYVEQLSSYYLVNKIKSFVKGNITKCELIEVDYKKTIAPPQTNPGTYITITNIVTSGCDVTITFETDAELPRGIVVNGIPNAFGQIPPPQLGPERYFNDTVFPDSNTITVTVESGGFWQFNLELHNVDADYVYSNTWPFANDGTCIFVPPQPELTYIRITTIQKLSVQGNMRTIKIYFETDLQLPSFLNLFGSESQFAGFFNDNVFVGSDYFIVKTCTDNAFGNQINWSITLSKGNVSSNTAISS